MENKVIAIAHDTLVLAQSSEAPWRVLSALRKLSTMVVLQVMPGHKTRTGL